MTQTLLAVRNNRLNEYPVSDRFSLKEEIDHPYTNLFWPRPLIYGYILNRNSQLGHPYYGWALPRN